MARDAINDDRHWGGYVADSADKIVEKAIALYSAYGQEAWLVAQHNGIACYIVSCPNNTLTTLIIR